MIRLAGTIGRLEPLPDSQRAVRVDRPGEIDPELVFLPDLAGVGLIGELDRLAAFLLEDAQDRLPEADPLGGVRLLAHQVVTLGAHAHRQDVVGVPGRFAPDRGQRGVQADQFLVAKHLHPGKPVGVSPNGIEHAGEVGVEFAAALFEQVGEQLRQFVVRQGPLGRVEQLIPARLRRRRLERLGDELVPRIGADAAGRAHGTGQGVQQHQGPHHLPPAAYCPMRRRARHGRRTGCRRRRSRGRAARSATPGFRFPAGRTRA